MPAGKHSDDFSDARVGDEVFYRWRGMSGTEAHVCKIEKVHKRYVFADGMKFRRDDGRPVGDYSYRGPGHLQYLTAERRPEIEAEVAAERAKSLCRYAGNALIDAARDPDKTALVNKLIPNLAEVVKALKEGEQ